MKGNILKRIISTILASFICTQSVFAEVINNMSSIANISAGQTTTIIVGDMETISENEITVPINISNNAGLTGLTLSVEYDFNVLTLTSIVRGEALSGLVFTKPGSLVLNPIKLVWDGVDPDSSNGNIVLFEFTTTDDVDDIENIIDITVDTACDEDLENVETVVQYEVLSSDIESEEIDIINPVIPDVEMENTDVVKPIIPDIELGDELTNQPSSSQTDNAQIVEYDVTYNVIASSEGKEMIINYSVGNYPEYDTVLLIAALYDEDRLCDIETKSLSIDGTTNTDSITLHLPENGEGYSIKLMVWEDLSTFKPLGDVKEILDVDNYLYEKYIYVTAEANSSFNVYMTATMVNGDNGAATHTIKYDPSKISPVDLCGFTYAKELVAGEVINTNIIVQNVDLANGEIVYRFNLEAGRNSGINNYIKFRATEELDNELIFYTIQ